MPGPRTQERPTAYADRVGAWYVRSRSDQQRKEHGLFLTPVPTAEFMAKRITAEARKVRVLDPAAGAGILCCAAVEALVSRRPRPQRVELTAYEIDRELIAPLRVVLDHLADWCCRRYQVTVVVHIEAADFIMANTRTLRPRGLFPARPEIENFDVVIANPPYFKIGKDDPRAAAAAEVVHGQPNIYALFMAVGASLLRKDGDFVFITPRSFASGPYFRQFRTVFFDMIRPTGVHVFGSRREAFRRDAVLQENVIISGVRQDRWHGDAAAAPLAISSSLGVDDIDRPSVREVPAEKVLDLASVDKVLRLPICDDDEEALALVDSWPSSLADLGLNISTGPVVPFRATKFIAGTGTVPASHVPLLWMNHVRAMEATWPLDRHKPEYIARSAKALLVPSSNYVLIRRFSAKEEARRLTAAPYIAADFAVPEVGLENHLNYVHRPGGQLSEDEAWGLAALYNSRLLDTWFRAVNGNTQVNATELRAMPLPAQETIVALGQRTRRLADPMAELDALVANVITAPVFKEAVLGSRPRSTGNSRSLGHAAGPAQPDGGNDAHRALRSHARGSVDGGRATAMHGHQWHHGLPRGTLRCEVRSEHAGESMSDRVRPISYLEARDERRQESLALVKMLALGDHQIEAGQVQPAAEVVARLREGQQADSGDRGRSA